MEGCGCGDRPAPLAGSAVVESAAAVWTGAVRVRHRGLRPASVVLYLARRFRPASSPPASPCGDTDGYIEDCRSPVPHAGRVVWLACPRPCPGRCFDRRWRYPGEVLARWLGLRRRRDLRSSACVSPPLLCSLAMVREEHAPIVGRSGLPMPQGRLSSARRVRSLGAHQR